MEYITESLENQHNKCQKNQLKEYKLHHNNLKLQNKKWPYAETPITDRCPIKVMV